MSVQLKTYITDANKSTTLSSQLSNVINVSNFINKPENVSNGRDEIWNSDKSKTQRRT